MKHFFFFLFFLLPFQSKSQINCDYSLDYNGDPGAVNIYTIPVLPYDIWVFDFCAQNVPDRLTIYTNNNKTDSITFYTGGLLKPADLLLDSNSYIGYSELEYVSGHLYTIRKQGVASPLDFPCGYMFVAGKLRLTFHVPVGMCNMIVKTTGNLEIGTIYYLCVHKVQDGFIPVTDTIYTDYCGKKNPEIIETYCKKTLTIYNDSSIYDTPIILNPTCIDKQDGAILFSKYPQYNLFDLAYGNYKVIVENSVCRKEFAVQLTAKQLCEYYIPNVISSNNDGINDEFMLFAPVNIDYDLSIYDRWGEMVFHNKCMSNFSGWTANGFAVGVYCYVIKCLEQTIVGDVTIVR